jgi:tetratricopeptide (TPR) repeat protein
MTAKENDNTEVLPQAGDLQRYELPEHLLEKMRGERMPVGEELCRALEEWYPFSFHYRRHNSTYVLDVFRFMGWALGGRVHEVLNHLESSDIQLRKDIARQIRWFGTFDRPGPSWPSAHLSGIVGWLAKALGNRTWLPDKAWYRRRGEARREFDRRYPELFRNRVTAGTGLDGIDELVAYVDGNSSLVERIYDVLKDPACNCPQQRVRAITAIARIIAEHPRMLDGRLYGMFSSRISEDPVEFHREVARIATCISYSTNSERQAAIHKLCLFLHGIPDNELARLSLEGLLKLRRDGERLPYGVWKVVISIAEAPTGPNQLARNLLNKLEFWEKPVSDKASALERADYHYAREEYELALMALNEGLEAVPGDETLWCEKAILLFSYLWRNDEALEALDHVVALEGSVDSKLLLQGRIHLDNENYDKTLMLFDMISVNGLSPLRRLQFYTFRGQSCMAVGQWSNAQQSFETAASLINLQLAEDHRVERCMGIIKEELPKCQEMNKTAAGGQAAARSAYGQ